MATPAAPKGSNVPLIVGGLAAAAAVGAALLLGSSSTPAKNQPGGAVSFDTLVQQLAQMEQTYAQLVQENQQIASQIADAKQKVADAQSALAAAKQTTQTLKSQLTAAQKSVTDAQSQAKTMQSQLAKLQSDTSSLTASSTAQQQKNAEIKQLVASLVTENAQLQQKLAALQAQFQQLQATANQLQQQIDATEADLAQIDQQLTTVQTEIAKQQALIKQLGQQIATLKAEIAILQQAISLYLSRQSTLENIASNFEAGMTRSIAGTGAGWSATAVQSHMEAYAQSMVAQFQALPAGALNPNNYLHTNEVHSTGEIFDTARVRPLIIPWLQTVTIEWNDLAKGEAFRAYVAGSILVGRKADGSLDVIWSANVEGDGNLFGAHNNTTRGTTTRRLAAGEYAIISWATHDSYADTTLVYQGLAVK